MDGCVVFSNGLGVAMDFAGDDSDYICAWDVVYIGGWIVIFNRCDILFVAQDEICACALAFVRYRGQCVFLFCRAARFDN